MKTHPVADRKLRRIAEDIEEAIDCTVCANCCRVATVKLVERDVEKIARFLRISPAKFLAEYTIEDPEEGVILKRTEAGCVFLSGNECTIYDVRPATCEYFPHLVRGPGSMASRMWQMIDRAVYCPIVFNTLEGYKKELGFRR